MLKQIASRMRVFVGAAVVAVPAAAGAEIITYTFEGEITRADFLLNDFVGIQVGHTFTVTVELDSGAAPVADTETRRRWDRAAVRRFDVSIPDAAKFFTYLNEDEPFSTGTVVIEDNFDAEGLLRDNFFLAMDNTALGGASVNFVDEVVPRLRSSALSGLDLATEAELDPSRWQEAEMSIGTSISTGFVDGAITRVRVVPAPGAAVLLGLAMGARRRRA